MCGVDDHTVVSHEVQSFNGPVKFFITTKCSANVSTPMSNLSVAVDIGFSNWPFATWI